MTGRPLRVFTPDEDVLIRNWRERRLSPKAIGSAIGCSLPTLYRRIHELELPLQRNSGRPPSRGTLPGYCVRQANQRPT